MSTNPRQVELRYDPSVMDAKWQQRWETEGCTKYLMSPISLNGMR
ncbi:MAG: hypothetical protein CM1200mP15_03290 [Dehalococcoidia bacterium]|nr:MAG: hypothetical protein CM1200mP15_03290 [Dehalococcoidia bacterium]